MKYFDCACGGHALPASQRGIHARSNAHKDWATANGEPSQTDYETEYELPEELAKIIETGKADPVEAARQVRKYRSLHPFTDLAGHQTVRDFLESYGIPIIDIPKGTPRVEADQEFKRQRKQLMEAYARGD